MCQNILLSLSMILLLGESKTGSAVDSRSKFHKGPGQCAAGIKFTDAEVINADMGEDRLKKELFAKQAAGVPVLITSSQAAERSEKVLAELRDREFRMTEDDLHLFDPTKFTWAGIQQYNSISFKDLIEHLPRSRLHNEHRMYLRIGDAFEAVKTNHTGGSYFRLGYSGDMGWTFVKDFQEFGDRYPIALHHNVAYATVFVSPTMEGGTHLDENAGATYFSIRVLSGRKIVRLFPCFEGDEILKWGCAQRHWDNVTTPSHWFLRGAFKVGFSDWRRSHNGFEFSVLNSHRNLSFDFDEACAHFPSNGWNHGIPGYVEIEVNAGEDVFVPSGIPHQVVTPEPSVAVSVNCNPSPLHTLFFWEARTLFERTKMFHFMRSKSMRNMWETSIRNLNVNVEMIVNSDEFNVDEWLHLSERFPAAEWIKPRHFQRFPAPDPKEVVFEVLLSAASKRADHNIDVQDFNDYEDDGYEFELPAPNKLLAYAFVVLMILYQNRHLFAKSSPTSTKSQSADKPNVQETLQKPTSKKKAKPLLEEITTSAPKESNQVMESQRKAHNEPPNKCFLVVVLVVLIGIVWQCIQIFVREFSKLSAAR